MWNKHSAAHTSAPQPVDNAPLTPKKPYLQAVTQLGARVPHLRAVFDHFGRVRSLSTDDTAGLFNSPLLTTPALHARKFLNVGEVHTALGLRHVDLDHGQVDELPNLGYRVSFKQEVTTPEGVKLPVRKGFVQVYMDASGKVFNVTNTLRYGRRSIDLTGIITPAEAIAKVKSDLNFDNYASERAELMFSSHNEKIDAVYEVVVTANKPRRVMLVLVKAHTGEVVHTESLIKNARIPTGTGRSIEIDDASPRKKNGKGGSGGVAGRGFLRIPDPNTALSKQVHDLVVERLVNPKILATKRFVMYVKDTNHPVRAKADGTFNYKPGDPEFSAVVTLFALEKQADLYESWGMKRQTRAIPVVVEDADVEDNAYFDPEAYDIHSGVGTGTNNGGLTKYIAYDMGVLWHENGHHAVFLQTPGNDLPGVEGAAIHEGIGDVLGDLLMDFWFRKAFASELGKPLTKADVLADPRIIGLYAAPPKGIRIQKNNAKGPLVGEPHDDSLICGGAMADLLVAMVDAQDVDAGLENFGKLTLGALALVPAHRVTFRDLLNAYLAADSKLFGSANQALITTAFAAHGIKLQSNKNKRRGGGSSTVIIIIAD